MRRSRELKSALDGGIRLGKESSTARCADVAMGTTGYGLLERLYVRGILGVLARFGAHRHSNRLGDHLCGHQQPLARWTCRASILADRTHNLSCFALHFTDQDA